LNRLHFNIWPQENAHGPFHLRLALPDAESAVSDRHANYRSRPIIAASLDAFRVPRFVDEKPTVKWIDRNNEVRNVQPAGEFAAPINKAITSLAREHRGDQ
jgi:hypothetical protein